MNLNPEVQRNLWLEFSLHRVVAGQVVLGIILFIITSGSVDVIVTSNLCFNIFVLITLLKGTTQAASGISGEIINNTWDFKRLSSMTPTQLLLGKISSTMYSWYIALTVLAIYAIVTPLLIPVEYVVYNVLMLMMIALISQNISMFGVLMAITLNKSGNKKINWFAAVVTGLIATIPAYSLTVSPQNYMNDSMLISGIIYWFNLSMQPIRFYYALTFIVLLFSISASHWAFRKQLRMKTGPWLWVGIVVFAIVICGGLVYGVFTQYSNGYYRVSALTYSMWAMFCMALFSVVTAVFLENWDGTRYRRMLMLQKKGMTGTFINALPCWFLSLLISVLLLLVLSIMDFCYFSALGFACLAFVLRDIAILHYFKLKPGIKRPQAWGLFYLVLLYVLLPLALVTVGAGKAALLFLPSDLKSGYELRFAMIDMFPILSGSLQALFAWFMVSRNWRKYWGDNAYS